MKHTSGPWKSIKFGENETYVITNDAGTPGVHREIATVSFGYSEPAETEQHANAKLIAAAPELLEALKMAEGYVVGLKNQEMVAAAIAKATA
jgi:hypothetical protein